jgi:hypothetical protein
MKKLILTFTGISLLLISCEKLVDINNNPNSPENANPQFLLSNALSEASDNQAYWGWHAGNFLSQHTSNLEFLPVDRYDLGNNEGLWNETYRLMNDLQDISQSEEGNDSYTAVAYILKAHQASLLTDLWTDVPYADALKGESEENFTPAYNTQQEIYTSSGGILDLLEKSVDILTTSTGVIEGDIMFAGDKDSWIKFANSLRIRYLLRISAKQSVNIEMQSIVDDGMIFLDNSDNAEVPYLSSAPNQWTIFNEREGRYVDVRMSTSAETILTSLNDPRMEVYYKPTVNSNGGTLAYTGIPNGLSRDNQNAYDLNDVSLLGSFLRDQPDGVKASFMTYAELQFCLAEAASKGIISGMPTTYYNSAIQASFDYYNVTAPAGYFSTTAVLLDGTNDIEKIMTQKWIASFMNGYEAWIDIRRTGYPTLTVAQDNINNNVYPVRYVYPTTEQAVNGSNYSTAVTNIGGDNYNSKGWWEQ